MNVRSFLIYNPAPTSLMLETRLSEIKPEDLGLVGKGYILTDVRLGPDYRFGLCGDFVARYIFTPAVLGIQVIQTRSHAQRACDFLKQTWAAKGKNFFPDEPSAWDTADA